MRSPDRAGTPSNSNKDTMSDFDIASAPSPDPSSASPAASIWNPARSELLEWFRRDAPSLAGPYEAAVFLVYTPSVPARVHLVCHLVRDIYVTLPQILDGDFRFQSAGAVYPSFVEKIATHWRSPDSSSLSTAATPAQAPGAPDSVGVPWAGARAVDDLLAKYEAIKKQPKSAEVLARALFRRFAESGFEPPTRLASMFEKERVWFVQRAHLKREHTEAHSEDELLEHFASFEGALHSLVGRYFTGREDLDAILSEANA